MSPETVSNGESGLFTENPENKIAYNGSGAAISEAPLSYHPGF